MIQSYFPRGEFSGLSIHAQRPTAGAPALVCLTASDGAFRFCEFFTAAQAREFAHALELAAEEIENVEARV